MLKKNVLNFEKKITFAGSNKIRFCFYN